MSASIRRRSRLAMFLLPSALLATLALLLPSCEGGNFCLLGYTTKPPYDDTIHSVRVPMVKVKNGVYRDSVRQGIEMDLTKALVRNIEWKTPFKVKDDADTELTVSIVNLTKNILNRSQVNLPREVETQLGVEVTWIDLHSGKNLTRPARGPGSVLPPPAAVDCPPGTPPPTPPGVAIYSLGHFIPEIGQSTTTAYKENVDNLAVQIVSMMEEPW